MKTTIDIADDLIRRARMIQEREGMTFRELVEEGLRGVLEKRAKPARKYKFQPVVVGEPYKPGMKVPDVTRMIAESNERAWFKRESGKERIAEPGAKYGASKKAPRRKKS